MKFIETTHIAVNAPEILPYYESLLDAISEKLKDQQVKILSNFLSSVILIIYENLCQFFIFIFVIQWLHYCQP